MKALTPLLPLSALRVQAQDDIFDIPKVVLGLRAQKERHPKHIFDGHDRRRGKTKRRKSLQRKCPKSVTLYHKSLQLALLPNLSYLWSNYEAVHAVLCSHWSSRWSLGGQRRQTWWCHHVSFSVNLANLHQIFSPVIKLLNNGVATMCLNPKKVCLKGEAIFLTHKIYKLEYILKIWKGRGYKNKQTNK